MVGTEIVVPVVNVAAAPSESSDEKLDTGAIIGIIIAGVVVFLMIAGVTAFCCYKKHISNKNKTGVEIVSVMKTRGDPEITIKKGELSYSRANKFDDCPRIHTEEEEISGTED